MSIDMRCLQRDSVLLHSLVQIVSHTFAPKSIIAFEPFIRREIQLLLDRWDEFCSKAKEQNTQGPRGLNGRAWLDALMWLNFFAFDTIGDLAFGKRG